MIKIDVEKLVNKIRNHGDPKTSVGNPFFELTPGECFDLIEYIDKLREKAIKVEASSDKGIKIGANLSKREYFAALAMQAQLSADAGLLINVSAAQVAIFAIRVADALIAELSKEAK